jgi:POLO box duplicated region.
MFFRLSNRVVQVSFLDKSELLLCSDKKIVIFVDKLGDVSEYNLSNAMESSNRDLTKRLRYSKEVLTSMLQPNNNNH